MSPEPEVEPVPEAVPKQGRDGGPGEAQSLISSESEVEPIPETVPAPILDVEPIEPVTALSRGGGPGVAQDPAPVLPQDHPPGAKAQDQIVMSTAIQETPLQKFVHYINSNPNIKPFDLYTKVKPSCSKPPPGVSKPSSKTKSKKPKTKVIGKPKRNLSSVKTQKSILSYLSETRDICIKINENEISKDSKKLSTSSLPHDSTRKLYHGPSISLTTN